MSLQGAVAQSVSWTQRLVLLQNLWTHGTVAELGVGRGAVAELGRCSRTPACSAARDAGAVGGAAVGELL